MQVPIPCLFLRHLPLLMLTALSLLGSIEGVTDLIVLGFWHLVFSHSLLPLVLFPTHSFSCFFVCFCLSSESELGTGLAASLGVLFCFCLMSSESELALAALFEVLFCFFKCHQNQNLLHRKLCLALVQCHQNQTLLLHWEICFASL